MAKDKKSFILYSDAIHTVEKLSDMDAGQLLKHLLRYVNDQNPKTENPLVEIAFEPIKQQLKRDLVKFEDVKVKRSEAGKAGATKRWQEIANANKGIQTIANIAVNDNVNDNVISKDIYTKQKFIFLSALIDYGFDEKLSKEWMQVRKQKQAVNTETAFNKFIKQVEIHGGDKNYILRSCVENSWKGFEASWLVKPPTAAYGLTNDWDG
jgi:hypothetical protein